MPGIDHEPGGYRYTPGIPPYSAGVVAAADHVIVRTTLRQPTGWRAGFKVIDQVLADAGRPASALCAVELRCPTPHSFNGFGTFNDDYRQALDHRGILLADGTNPVARTNVAPLIDAGAETELHAFSHTVPRADLGDLPSGPTDRQPSFVIAGAGDLDDQSDLRPEAIVGGESGWDESGPDRADAVLDEMEARLQSLGLSWADSDSVVVYSVERIGSVLESTVLPRLGSAARRGLHWYHARPPIEGLRFEMDLRGGVVERVR